MAFNCEYSLLIFSGIFLNSSDSLFVTNNKSEIYSKLLDEAKVKHVVLNAKNHENEAEIIANAGKLNSVIITTSISGRGVDIQLGGKKGSEPDKELLVNKDKTSIKCPGFASEVVDKVGSGDALLALLSICLFYDIGEDLSLFIASIAAAQSVESIGTSRPVSKILLLKTISHFLK